MSPPAAAGTAGQCSAAACNGGCAARGLGGSDPRPRLGVTHAAAPHPGCIFAAGKHYAPQRLLFFTSPSHPLRCRNQFTRPLLLLIIITIIIFHLFSGLWLHPDLPSLSAHTHSADGPPIITRSPYCAKPPSMGPPYPHPHPHGVYAGGVQPMGGSPPSLLAQSALGVAKHCNTAHGHISSAPFICSCLEKDLGGEMEERGGEL